MDDHDRIKDKTYRPKRRTILVGKGTGEPLGIECAGVRYMIDTIPMRQRTALLRQEVGSDGAAIPVVRPIAYFQHADDAAEFLRWMVEDA